MLRVQGHEFPQFDSGWDAYALLCEIELGIDRLGSFHASHRPVIYTVELERFTEQLRALDRDPTGQATLEHSAEQIGLTIRLDADNGTLEGFLADSTAGRLDFENIDTDRAFVRRAPDQLEPILDTFPVHSSLHDRSPPTASARSVSPRPQPGEPSNTPGPNSIVPWFLAPARRATRLRSATSPPVRQQVGGSLFDRRKGVSFRPALTLGTVDPCTFGERP